MHSFDVDTALRAREISSSRGNHHRTRLTWYAAAFQQRRRLVHFNHVQALSERPRPVQGGHLRWKPHRKRIASARKRRDMEPEHPRGKETLRTVKLDKPPNREEDQTVVASVTRVMFPIC